MPKNKNKNKILKLRSSDGKILTVEADVIRQAKTIDDMLRDLEDQGFSDDDEPVPLPNITSNILKKIIEWCRHHKNDDPLTEDPSASEPNLKPEELPPWDTEFLNVDQDTLYELIMAANYLNIKRLLDMGCTAVSNMLKGKTTDEIRGTFSGDVKDDFSFKEEEAEVRRENVWVEKK